MLGMLRLIPVRRAIARVVVLLQVDVDVGAVGVAAVVGVRGVERTCVGGAGQMVAGVLVVGGIGHPLATGVGTRGCLEVLEADGYALLCVNFFSRILV